MGDADQAIFTRQRGRVSRVFCWSGQTTLQESLQGLERITTRAGIRLLLALLCFLYSYHSVVTSDGARKDCVGERARINSRDFIEHARRAVQRDDLRDMIKGFVSFENEIGWQVPKWTRQFRPLTPAEG